MQCATCRALVSFEAGFAFAPGTAPTSVQIDDGLPNTLLSRGAAAMAWCSPQCWPFAKVQQKAV